ncbi:hypothetical protein BJ912DRAFT_1065534 [Pholiota molesta]|nr:hypothetical protein BJ912DRAFT_1065534 [Pholiota molesta]
MSFRIFLLFSSSLSTSLSRLSRDCLAAVDVSLHDLSAGEFDERDDGWNAHFVAREDKFYKTLRGVPYIIQHQLTASEPSTTDPTRGSIPHPPSPPHLRTVVEETPSTYPPTTAQAPRVVRTTTHRTHSPPTPQHVEYAHTIEDGHQKSTSPIPAPLAP